MRNIWAMVAGALIVAAAPASAFAGGEVNAGTYSVNGKNIDGSSYKGTAKIAIVSDTTCTITWKTGGSTSDGICMRDNDSFAAAYRLGDAVGLVIYKINDNGSLDGVWTIAGTPGAGSEKLTPQ